MNGTLEHSSKKYLVMYYKNEIKIGIRRKFDKKDTAFELGGKDCDLGEDALRSFADDALRKLDSGESEENVAEWARAAVTT